MNAAVTTVYPRWTAGLKPLLLLVGIAAAVAAGVSVVLWSRGPSYSLLYANLATEDQAQVTQALDTAGIPYRLTPNGNGIEVASEHVSDARLKLAGQGLPEGDGGFSMLSKDPGLGVSQFIESARYQHALEIELAHTIASMRPVDGARVHIAASADSAFVRDRRPASASVFVQLKSGRVLSQEQVQAIVNLVASSVPNLEAGQVTVVDQQGRLLSAPQGNDDLALREAHFELVRQIEDDYMQRIETLLGPLVGPGRVRAQVVAELDTAVTEEAREQYQPGSQIVRSEQLSEQTTRDGASAGGVPGALSNQPPAAGVAQPPPAQRAAASTGATAASGGTGGTGGAAGSPAGTGRPGATPAGGDATAAQISPENVSKESTRNYEMDRTLNYTRQPAGTLKRLTVAVLLDNVRTVDKDGKTHERPLSQVELDHITQLVKDAVGFDAKRGDSVNVFNSTFQSDGQPADAPLEQVPLWQQPLVTELAKLAAGLIVVLVLVLAVLRPLVRTLIGPARALLNASAQLPAVEAPGAAAAAAAAAAPQVPAPQRYEQQITSARALVNQDPRRVAQVVRTWVATDE